VGDWTGHSIPGLDLTKLRTSRSAAKSALTDVQSVQFEHVAVLILKRNIDLKIAAGYGCVDGGNNAGCDQLHHRPLRMFQHDQGKLATFKILLIADILISGHHEVKPGLLGSFTDQCAVGEFFPACARASSTVWPIKKRASPRGVPLSKRMRMKRRANRSSAPYRANVRRKP